MTGQRTAVDSDWRGAVGETTWTGHTQHIRARRTACIRCKWRTNRNAMRNTSRAATAPVTRSYTSPSFWSLRPGSRYFFVSRNIRRSFPSPLHLRSARKNTHVAIHSNDPLDCEATHLQRPSEGQATRRVGKPSGHSQQCSVGRVAVEARTSAAPSKVPSVGGGDSSVSF